MEVEITDTLSLYYFSEPAKDLHITRTANCLSISRQTLSNHIVRLEEHYGVRLPNRKPSFSLTYAGEYILSFTETMNRENANLIDILADIQKQRRDPILFDASTLHMSASLPSILPELSSRYPNVEIRITDVNSKQLGQLVLSGNLDLTIVISGGGHPSTEEKLLTSDQIYLCATDTLLWRYYGDGARDLKRKARNMMDVKDFSRLPFCIPNNRMGQNIQKCFSEAGFTPNIYTTNAYMQISTSISLKGPVICFAIRNSILNQGDEISEDINVFPLYYKGELLLQQISAVYHKDYYLSTYIQYFQELILKCFHEVEQIPTEELVNSSSISLQ